MFLEPCPDKPNCVSTEAKDKRHAIAAIPYKDDMRKAMERMKAVVAKMPNTRLINESADRLIYEFRSSFFRFVDDVVFVFVEKEKSIHFRSASRTGHSDLGVNRERMEKIRQLYTSS